MENYDLSIAIPFYNEEKTVKELTKRLVNEFEKNSIDYELILVDNGSWDKTPEIVEELAKKNKRIKPVHVKINQGYGFGILSGLNVANGKYIGYIDGDLEVLPSDVIKVYNKLRKEKADVCKGKRDIRSSAGFRKISSYLYDSLFLLMYFKHIEQINAKPKIMKRDCFKNMKLKSKDWFIDTEILIKSLKYNYKITTEITTYAHKKNHKSHIRFSTIFEFLKNIIKYRFTD